jgi:hypothetical protein
LMGTQITGPGANSGAQSQSRTMSAPLTKGSMNGVASSSILTQSVGFPPMRRPMTEEVTSAKGWVDEQKRAAFNRTYNHFLIQSSFANLSHSLTSGFERVAGYPPVPLVSIHAVQTASQSHAPPHPLPQCPLGWPRPHHRHQRRLKCLPCTPTVGITSNAPCVHPIAYAMTLNVSHAHPLLASPQTPPACTRSHTQ